MKNYFILALVFIGCISGKLNLEREYETATKNINPYFREIIQNIDNHFLKQQGNGAAIFLKSKLDTIESKNDYSNFEVNEVDRLEQDVWIASSNLNNGILTIDIGQIFGNQFITHKIKDKKITTTFKEYYKVSAQYIPPNHLSFLIQNVPKFQDQSDVVTRVQPLL